MIGYTTLGVQNLGAAKQSYTELFDARVLVDVGRLGLMSNSIDEPMNSVCEPYSKQEPHPGKGVMVASRGGSKEGAKALCEKALELGAPCDGKPGQRIENAFYGAFVNDPDGNKLCFFDFS